MIEMMLTLGVLYPAIAAAIVWAVNRHSIVVLRHEVRALEAKVAALTPRAAPTARSVLVTPTSRLADDALAAATAPRPAPAADSGAVSSAPTTQPVVDATSLPEHADVAAARATAADDRGETAPRGRATAGAPAAAEQVATAEAATAVPVPSATPPSPSQVEQAAAPDTPAAAPEQATAGRNAPPAAADPSPELTPTSPGARDTAAETEAAAALLAAPPAWVSRLTSGAKAWLFGGNLVAKLGLVILFLGVAFLLKYVAATVDIPIELRLAAVVLADLVLLGWGWHLRATRRELALPIQGTASAILMLVVFGAFQHYHLIPAGAAFTLLVLLTAFTCALALLQDAVWLAAFGITGGFASPLLVATGNGNHIALFSYYALLNLGVFAIALRRAWRPLNLLGFWFTFTVGTGWGALRYAPDHYLSAQAFLIVFFLFYVAIALAYARQREPHFRDYIDVSLVLGTPLLTFGLQAGLVHDFQYGLAVSAVTLGAFYIVLATALLRRDGQRWSLMVATFAALGAIFTSLAIPFAVNGRWTAAAWAMEGAGFVWYGTRTHVTRIRVFGLILQAGATLSFVSACGGLDEANARASALWLGCLLLGASAFATATIYRRRATDTTPEAPICNGMLAAAAVWALAAWWIEAKIRTSGTELTNWFAVGAVCTAALMHAVGTRMTWRLAHVLAVGAEIAGALAVCATSGIGTEWLGRIETGYYPCALAGPALLALAILASSRAIARDNAREDYTDMSSLLIGIGGVLWFGPILNIAAGRIGDVMPDALGSTDGRWLATYASTLTACALACPVIARRLAWPQVRWLGTACWAMQAVLAIGMLLTLYAARRQPEAASWAAWAILWGGGECLLTKTPREPTPAERVPLQLLHVMRTAAPWAAIWPAGRLALDAWLHTAIGSPSDIDLATWSVNAGWADYVPTWAMMLALVFLLRRADGSWPTRPLSDWYRDVVVPGGAALILLRVAAWNVVQDGGMAPLPYVPVLNPLDITTIAAAALGMAAMYHRTVDAPGARVVPKWLAPGAAAIAFAWLNLMLLRSASHYLDLPYWIGDLAGSQAVQAMLSLAWCASALVLMRYAARRAKCKMWSVGAAQLGVVVCKLFFVDLADHGGVARIVSFLGVGLLMLLIGYFAPFPKAGDGHAAAATRSHAPKETS